MKKFFSNPAVKEYLFSSLITFVSGFALSLSVSAETLDLHSLGAATVVAILMTAVRAGFKGVIVFLVSKIKPPTTETLQ